MKNHNSGFGTLTLIVTVALTVLIIGLLGYIAWDNIYGEGSSDDETASVAQEYTKEQQEAQIKQAYFSVNPNAEGTVGFTIDTSTTSPSSVKGYETTSVSIQPLESQTGGAQGIFYRQDGGEWKYGVVSQAELNCEDITDADAQKGLAAISCWDSSVSTAFGGQSTTYGDYFGLN